MDNLDSKAVLSKLQILLKFVEMDMTACQTTGNLLKKKTWRFKLASIFISFLITITLGLTLNTEETIIGINVGLLVKNLAVILSALLTAVNTWEAFGNYQTRSGQEAAMLNKLNMLYKDILLYTDRNETCSYDTYVDFKGRYDAIQEEYIQDRASSEKEKSDSETKDEN
ncbi:hypothetical protein NYE69_26950 [Paenibacillus sp. FSL R5-0527]|uniref:hypothetical protein n=1 Tax=Paenibacillus sp. FSL R5-0527 TaxID=2975321 RepID=UPI000979F7D9|nr:hypothetical protein BK140_22535 [Paenibacillus macerans]